MKTKNETFWIIESTPGMYVLNEHVLTPVIKNAQRFSNREEARKDKRKYNSRSSEKFIHLEIVPEEFRII